jgi:hypothetical protein
LAVFLKVDGQHVFANLSDPFQNKKKFSWNSRWKKIDATGREKI